MEITDTGWVPGACGKNRYCLGAGSLGRGSALQTGFGCSGLGSLGLGSPVRTGYSCWGSGSAGLCQAPLRLSGLVCVFFKEVRGGLSLSLNPPHNLTPTKVPGSFLSIF